MSGDNYYMQGTNNTPKIDFNGVTGELLLEGRSIPSNSIGVYGEAYEWITRYAEDPRPTTNFRMNLDYFNTSSVIWISKMIKVLSNMEFPDYTLMLYVYLDIEDVVELDPQDVVDLLTPMFDFNKEPTVNLCIKLCGLDSNGKVIKESDVLL
jgi:hypothetical protein